MSEITAFSTDEELVMASFDVSSLFTNIPLDETIDLCTDLIFDEYDKLQYRDCSLDRTQFRKLLGFAVKENHFVFNGQLFDQIDGVAMGSPLGPSLAKAWFPYDRNSRRCVAEAGSGTHRRRFLLMETFPERRRRRRRSDGDSTGTH